MAMEIEVGNVMTLKVVTEDEDAPITKIVRDMEASVENRGCCYNEKRYASRDSY